MPTRRADGTLYPSTPRPNTCEICGELGSQRSKVYHIDGLTAHWHCRPKDKCTEDGCCEEVKAKGLCSHHYNLAYYHRDLDRSRERARRWYIENAERAKARRDRRDKQQMREYQRKYYWADRLRGVAIAANAKARRLGISGELTGAGIAARIAYFGGKCWICGGSANTIDHIVPFARGGPNIHANIRPACQSCNSKKGTRLWLY